MRGVLILLVVGAGLIVLDRALERPAGGASPAAPIAVDACRETRPRLRGREDAIGPDGVALYRNGFVMMRVCGPGVLTLALDGTAALGTGAQVVVSLGTDLLREGYVAAPRTWTLTVPRAGWITAGFVNDAAGEGEDRNLWVERVSFAPR